MKLLLSALACCVSLTLFACDDDESAGDESSNGTTAEADCTFVTEADVKSILGIDVVRVPRDPAQGAGSTCNGNLAVVKADGKDDMVLLLETVSREQFDHPSELMLEAYPNIETPTDLGAEAKMFLGSDPVKGAKVLWMYKNGQGYEVVTFFAIGTDTPQLTREQLLTLGTLIGTRI